MAKKKPSEKTARKPVKKKPPVANAGSENGEVKKKGRSPQTLAHARLQRLAKKHHPPDEYFRGDMERPW